MRLARALVMCASVSLAIAASAGWAAPRQGPLTRQGQIRRIAAAAYVYGFAILAEERVIDVFPQNTLINVTRLSTPAERLVPAPNVDTLYTVARLALAGGPVIVHVPAEHGRYYTLQLLDAYTNTFAYIGRRVTGGGAGNFALIGPRWRGRIPAGIRRIRAPTPTVWLLGRTLVNGPADLSAVNAIQHRYALSTLSGGARLPSIFLPRSTLTPPPLPTGLVFLDALDTAMAQNPPPRSDRPLVRRLASVGIAPGRAVSREGLGVATLNALTAGLRDGHSEIFAYARRLKLESEREHNGWLLPPRATGDYGHNFLLRAYVAMVALGANIPAEAIYPFASVDRDLAPLTGTRRYVLRFAPGDLPPVNAFWSVTMYDRNLFLVPNPIDRYAIGNRTAGLHRNRDGSLDIMLQHSPPRRGANWLPTPAGAFVLALRLYQPKRPVLQGRWALPTISRVG
jgi:hypothetical protein